MWGMIATWRMALEGVEKGANMLAQGEFSGDSIVTTIKEVEDVEYYKSVGYGGLPNKEMEVELDAAYMNGTTLDVGAVVSVKNVANPVLLAKRLSTEKVNSMLSGVGAETFAKDHDFEMKNMLTERATIHYHNKVEELKESALKPYDGHDTIGVVGVDTNGTVCSATSTSGLFMKHPGRVGDSPIAGSGFYADSEVGGASATGLGEDLMKGCISYEITRLMKDGLHPQAACEKAVVELHEKLTKMRGVAGDISVVAMNKNGEYGAATNIEKFSFVVATQNEAPTVYIASYLNHEHKIEKATHEWIQNYVTKRMKPVVKQYE